MIIIAEIVLSMSGKEDPGFNAVVVRGSCIIDIGRAHLMIRRYPHHRVLDLGRAVLTPGLVNVHAHLELPFIAGPRRGSGYVDWVLNLLRAKSRLAPSDYRRAAERNVRSLIESGTTTVGEICTHEASPAAIHRHRIRAVIFHEIISMRKGEALRLPKGLSPSALVSHGFSPHSPHTISPDALEQVHRHAKQRNMPLSMHVAESADEHLLLRRQSGALDRLYAAAGWDRAWAPEGRTSISYLAGRQVISRRFLAVHAVQASPADIALFRKFGAPVAHCPRSNHFLKVGTMPLRSMLAAGVTVGLGTDSLASVPTLSLWDEMRFAYRQHRRQGITAQDILLLATRGSAKALGLEHLIGSLEPGKKADIIALPLPRRNTGDLCSDLLRETRTCSMTMVNGRILHQTASRRRQHVPR